MKVEVLFMTPVRVAGHRFPDVVTYDDGPLVRALLKSGKAVLIDPPHLPGYNDEEYQEVKGETVPEYVAPVADEEIVLEPEPTPEPKEIAKLVSFQIKPEEIEAHEHEPNKRAPQRRTRKIVKLDQID
jgi:hypothetical protein